MPNVTQYVEMRVVGPTGTQVGMLRAYNSGELTWAPTGAHAVSRIPTHAFSGWVAAMVDSGLACDPAIPMALAHSPTTGLGMVPTVLAVNPERARVPRNCGDSADLQL